MSLIALFFAALACGAPLVSAAPTSETWLSSCYPALDFQKPLIMPQNNTDWWCDPSTEYAFVGFSYEVTDCEFRWLNFGREASNNYFRPES